MEATIRPSCLSNTLPLSTPLPNVTPIVITQGNADVEIRWLIEEGNGKYNADISTTANLLIGSEGADFANHVESVTLERVTFSYDARDKIAVEASQQFGDDGPLLYFQSNVRLDNCVFTSTAGLRVRLAATKDVITLEGDTFCCADGSDVVVHLNGENTKVEVERGATAHIDQPGAIATGMGRGRIHINVAGGIARPTKFNDQVYEHVDGGIIEVEVKHPDGSYYYQDYYVSYAKLKFTSYADHLINENRLDELLELAWSKIKDPMSTAEDVNKGVFYLAKAAPHHGQTERMLAELLEKAKSNIEPHATTEASTKITSLRHLRIAANAGYKPADEWLGERISENVAKVMHGSGEIFASGVSFIMCACEAGCPAAIEVDYQYKQMFKVLMKSAIAGAPLTSDKIEMQRNLLFLNTLSKIGYQPAIEYKKYLSQYLFNAGMANLENPNLDQKYIRKGALDLHMASEVGHEPAITYRKRLLPLWLDKAIMKIESPISNSDDRNEGRFYLELACDAGYKPAIAYQKRIQETN